MVIGGFGRNRSSDENQVTTGQQEEVYEENAISQEEVEKRLNRNGDFASCVLKGITIEEMETAKLNFSASEIIEGEVLDFAARGSDFSSATIRSTHFYDVDLEKSIFKNSEIQDAHFKDAAMAACDFTNSSLTEVQFEDVDLKNANFNNCALSQTHFVDVELKNAKFTQCDLHGVVFVDVNLEGVDLSGSDIQNLKIRDCEGRIRYDSDVVDSEDLEEFAKRL